MRALILSDGSLGHLNQSIAFCKHLNIDYDIVTIRYKNKLFRSLSYILDLLSIYSKKIFIYNGLNKTKYDFVVSCGSRTYYANKYFNRLFKSKNIALMLPDFYRLDFDIIFAQLHDNPPNKDNIIPIPINFSYLEPKGIFDPKPNEKYLSIIIGGDDKTFKLKADQIKYYLEYIFSNFKDYKKLITTSPRTSKKIEELIEEYSFEYCLIYSKEKLNPIADFLLCSQYVFITMDSTSMISEAISSTKGSVVVLPIEKKGKNSKFDRFLKILSDNGYIEMFSNNSTPKITKKFDFGDILKNSKIKELLLS